MAKTVVGLYDSYADAQLAVQDLLNDGFDRKNISLVANDVVRHPSALLTEATQPVDADVVQGAGTGALAGGIAGLIVGLSAMLVPGIGPILIVGPLAGILIGASLGLVVGGLVGALIDVGVPQQEAEYYSEAVRRGGTLVTVQAADMDGDRAMDILNRHNAIDVEMRVALWRQGGWTAYNPKAEPYTAQEIASERSRYMAAQPAPYLPPVESLSSTTPTYQAGVPVPPVSIAPVEATEVESESMADVPPPEAPNPPAPVNRRPVAVYPYPGTVTEPIRVEEPPMPMDTIKDSDRDLVGAKGGEADSIPGNRPGDYQNSDLGGEVSAFDSLTDKP
jgi:hypothetical protein